MRRPSLLLLIVCLSYSCFNEVKGQESPIPQGAIPITHRSHIYIEGTVDGKKGNYVFDTGATNLYLDTTYYAANNFSFERLFKGVLPGAGVTPQMVKVIAENVDFYFGDHHYQTSNVPILQLKPIIGDFADGILGLKYFDNTVLEFNYDDKYLKVHENLNSIDLAGWTKVSLTRDGNRLYIPCEVIVDESIRIKGQYLLDFGSGGTVTITSQVAGEYDLANQVENKVPFFTKYGGIGGRSSSQLFKAGFSTGDFNFRQIDLKFCNDYAGAMSSRNYLGVVGSGILERFNIYLDFISNELYLKPNRNFNGPFNVSRLGFSFVDRRQTLKCWIVSGIYTSSNADNAGILIDDKILSVNGIHIKQLDYDKRKSFFDSMEKMKLEIERNGKTLVIEFDLKAVL